VAVNLSTEEVKHGGGRDYKPGKEAVNYHQIKHTGIVVIKGVLNLVYLLKKGYYYTVLLLHTIRAALALPHIQGSARL